MEHRSVQVIFKGQVLQSVPLDRPMLTIGRLKENDVVIDNLSVSRLHARIVLEGERVFLEDQGSGNGCLVNGRRVDRAPIAPGDEILIGKHELREYRAGLKLKLTLLLLEDRNAHDIRRQKVAGELDALVSQAKYARQ